MKEERNIVKTEEEFLKAYDLNRYDRPSLALDVVALRLGDIENNNYRKIEEKQLKILLVKRNDHPFKGCWSLPGGFVKMNQDLEEAVVEKFKEKTHISSVYLEQLYTWGELDRDPRGRIVSVSYLALLAQDDMAYRDIDLANTKWFDLSYRLKTGDQNKGDKTRQEVYDLILKDGDEELTAQTEVSRQKEGRYLKRQYKLIKSNSKLAFDHAKIIVYALERLKNKVEYTNIAFALMPELFTLTQLQMVYEILLGKPLIKANFRRKIADLLVESQEWKRDAGHRPSKLFRLNPEFDLI